MSNSLRDQLLKAGLVNDKQVKKALKEKRKESAQQPRPQAGERSDERQRETQGARAEKIERDRELNRQRAEALERKALAAQVRQLVEVNRQPKGDGDMPYNFVDGGRVKRLYVSDGVREQLSKGRLAIIKLDAEYELVPAEIADKIRSRDAASVVHWNDRPPAPEDSSEDPYARYQVPDDLIW